MLYHELLDTATRDDVKASLTTIVQVPTSIPGSLIRSVVQSLVNDVHTSTTGDAPCKLRREDASLALSALKNLGRNPNASSVISSSENLSLLLGIEKELRQSDLEAANEALRCIANALLLIQTSRDTWVEVGGAAYCAEQLKSASSPVDLFLLCRILFLSTTETSPFLETLMNGLSENSTNTDNIVTVIGDRLDFILERYLSGELFSREALVDLLKLTFNLLCHVPKLSLSTNASTSKVHVSAPSIGLSGGPELGERWDERLDGILPPLLRVFNRLPLNEQTPLAPPMSHILHALLAPPASEELKTAWLEDKGKAAESSAEPATPSAFQRAVIILEKSFEQYFPGNIDPDDKSVRNKAAQRDEDITHMLLPVVLVIAKYCHLSSACGNEFRRKVIPPDLDRTTPLEQRADTLGRCIRLMASVHFERLKDAVGEMLFAACDSDAQLLSRLIGYGNAAGFLFNRGMMAPPPKSDDGDEKPSEKLEFANQSTGQIDPISGMVKSEDRSKPLDEMTEEEKEREAEKLFVLFERMEKVTGMENPLKKAFHEGKLEKYAK